VKIGIGRGIAAAMALALVAAPAAGQTFSDSYTFLKAVKDRDGNKVTDLVGSSGSTVLNTRDRSNGDGALHYVARERDVTWLAFLLGKGARPDLQNNRGETPLSLAAQLGWLEGAQQLVAYKASVDLANGRGETPLILAVQRRDVAMVRLLLSRGADPKRTDRLAGLSALDYARQDVRGVAVLKLLEAKLAPPRPVQGPSAKPKL
jgi:ankyrin repeat protein